MAIKRLPACPFKRMLKEVPVVAHAPRKRERLIPVVLRQQMSHGLPGEVVRVRPGYARNHLIPKGMAMYATRPNLKDYAILPGTPEFDGLRVRREALELKEKVEKVGTLLFKRSCVSSESDELKTPIEAEDVSRMMFERSRLHIQADSIVLQNDAITKVGKCEAFFVMTADVIATISVEVQRS